MIGIRSRGRVAGRLLLGLVAAVALLVALTSVEIRAPGPPQPARWKDPFTGMEFVLVRAGSFRMGTLAHEAERDPAEILRAVRIGRPFYLGRFEVTQAEWTRVMEDNPSFFSGCARCPVEQISWAAVQALVRRLNERSQPGFRLPTEAEWEYACRGGSGEAFGRSASLSSRDANIDGSKPYNASQGVFREQTTTVGHFPANAWGLFDLAGNVAEWVEDHHCPYAEGADADPVGRCDTAERVVRGGSWFTAAAAARCGARAGQPEDAGAATIGVRLVHDVW